MANVKITDLTALSGALVGADLFEMVDDVAGTPASRKVTTLRNIRTLLTKPRWTAKEVQMMRGILRGIERGPRGE